MTAKIMRWQQADYLNTAADNETATWSLMGTGYKTLDESPSPQVDKEAFICDKVKSASINGYELSFAFDGYLMKDEATIQSLYKVGHDQKTGTEAERDYVRVDLWNSVTGSANTYKARKFRVAVEVTDCSAEGAKPIGVKGNLNQVGNMTPGTFNTSTKVFTADVTAGVPAK